MYTFLDHYDNEYGAIATIDATNAVNGEKSIKGEIYSNDNVLQNIDKGWRLRFQDEYFVITFAKPKDVGDKVQVSFDAVHQFFWDFSKMPANEQLADGSHTFQAYLEFIFKDTGYRYSLEQNAKAFEKQSFGYKSKLALFNDVVSTAGVEFQVNGKVVRILEKTGTDLSTVVRKNFNMNDLTIEKNIDGFITYQKGFGAWNDKDDHSKGRLEVEYESPLAKEFGRLGGEPVVDERYTDSQSLLSVLKSNVENSYTISVQIDMEDLTRAGYRYDQPVAGDYIMAINETLGFQEKIRIVSYTSQYDAKGTLISHKVTCNDIGSVKKQSSSYARLSKSVNESNQQIQDALIKANNALVTSEGKNTSYFGTEFPEDVPKGTLTKGDIFYRTVGDRTLMYFWNGSDWEDNPVINDTEEFKRSIDQQFEDFNTSYDEAKALQDQQIADVLAKAGTAEDLANQAKTDAASAVQRSSQLKEEALAEADRLVQEQSTALTEQIQSVDVRVDDVVNQVSSKVSQIDFDAVKKTVESNSTAITQNQSAIELKADKTVTDALATTVNQTKSELKITSDAVATKVSKTDFDATNQRLATAETTIRTQAGQIEQRLTSTQVESAINAKGYQTKAQVDNNITGRGYITNSALQPYALSTTVQNLVQETADSFSRTISETKALIPSDFGGYNLVQNGAFPTEISPWSGPVEIAYHEFYFQRTKPLFLLKTSSSREILASTNRFELRRNTDYTLSFRGFTSSNIASVDVLFLARKSTETNSYSTVKEIINKQRLSTSEVQYVTVTFNSGENDSAFLRFDNNGSTNGGLAFFFFGEVMLVEGRTARKWEPSYDELITVTKFHEVKDTVDSHTRTISEQGKSISQVLQTADGLVSRVENLSIGGVNRFKKSDTALNARVKSNGYVVIDTYLDAIDTDFVVSIWLKDIVDNPTNQVTLAICNPNNPNDNEQYNRYVPIIDGKAIVKFKHPQSSLRTAVLFYPNPNGYQPTSTANAVPYKYKYELGSIATDWSPAPEDSDEAVQAVSTQVSQLAGSWAVKNLTSSGAVLNQINLLANGTNRIDGRLTHITGSTLIDNGVIKSAMIGNAQINTAHIGTIDARQANIINLNASNITSGTITGINMRGGVLSAINGYMQLDLLTGNYNVLGEQSAIRKLGNGRPTHFFKMLNEAEPHSVRTIIGSNREGTEDPMTGAFTGIHILNSTTRSGYVDGITEASATDRVLLVGDDIASIHSINESDGWRFMNYHRTKAIATIEPYNWNSGRSHDVYANNFYLITGNNRFAATSLRVLLRRISWNLQHLKNGGHVAGLRPLNDLGF